MRPSPSLLAACLLLMLGLRLASNLVAQSFQAPQFEIRTSLAQSALFQPNIGIRIGANRMFFDFTAAAILPMVDNVRGPFGQDELLSPLESYGGIAYGGIGWRKEKARGFRMLILQLGGKYHATGLSYFGDGVAPSAECTIDHLRRLSIGPRILWAQGYRVGEHLGLELYGGFGVRMGPQWRKGVHWGEDWAHCQIDPWEASHGYPFDWRMERIRVVPTFHFGVSLTLH